jgi:hypothetical protein
VGVQVVVTGLPVGVVVVNKVVVELVSPGLVNVTQPVKNVVPITIIRTKVNKSVFTLSFFIISALFSFTLIIA